MYFQSVVVLLVSLSCLLYAENITFKNVTIRGYSIFVKKFEKVISSSHNLKDYLPEIIFDKIEVREQYVPVLYKGSLADLDELDELEIEYSEVRRIEPGSLSNVPLLRRLSLKGNKLEEIKSGVFNNLQLSTLDLSQNSLKKIASDAFNNLPNLLNIALADNQISFWDRDWFKNTPLLSRVSMQNNSITSIPPKAFQNLIGEKKYGSVDLTINLVFSYNKISKIHTAAFSNLKRINNLWLDNNELLSFEDNLLDGVEVDDLRIDNNKITCLEGNLSKIFKANTTHIDSNPLDCNCLENIKKWSKENNKNVYMFFSEMNCSAMRIKAKMEKLQQRLNEFKGEYEILPMPHKTSSAQK